MLIFLTLTLTFFSPLFCLSPYVYQFTCFSFQLPVRPSVCPSVSLSAYLSSDLSLISIFNFPYLSDFTHCRYGTVAHGWLNGGNTNGTNVTIVTNVKNVTNLSFDSRELVPQVKARPPLEWGFLNTIKQIGVCVSVCVCVCEFLRVCACV